jgi:RHH-type proline utilization regulon transcriptional repressor/proline dehydrogenase/delta 1-pyrroline-5-carboxylate dehydrogenase
MHLIAASFRMVENLFMNDPVSIYSESIRINKARFFPDMAVASNLPGSAVYSAKNTHAMADASLEPSIQAIGRTLYQRARDDSPGFYAGRRRMLKRAIADARLRDALFQFVDVLPQLRDHHMIAAHFRAYLGDFELGGMFGRMLRLGEHAWMAPLLQMTVARMARLFMVEEDAAVLAATLKKIDALPAEVSLDALGEAVLSEAEADVYAARILKLLGWLSASATPQPDLSVKLSALTPRFDPIDLEGSVARVLGRLEPIRTAAAQAGVSLTLDMENHDSRPLVLAAFRRLAEGSGIPPGLALQAYRPDAEMDLRALLELSWTPERPLRVRLVKGAYWDSEVALAAQRFWPSPVYTDKAVTDANFERLTALLFEAGERVYPMIASHNLRSLAHSLALARALGRAADSWEVQMLYGMADPLAAAMIEEGARLRMYLPVGDLIGGIAYLIRRLLENTASTSVLRQAYLEDTPPEGLLAPPAAPSHEKVNEQGFSNTPLADFSQDEPRRAMRAALVQVAEERGRDYPLHVALQSATATRWRDSRNPAAPAQSLGRIEQAEPAHVQQAIRHAVAAFPGWREMAVSERARLCRAAAQIMARRRFELAAWQVLEVGKAWREADADVAEAIDCWNYYADVAERLLDWRTTRDFPGEKNATRYEALGPTAVIAPWNFPLAILSGMSAAALVCGNPVIMKPATPAQINACKLHEILLEAGFPPAVAQLLPGDGVSLGSLLAAHPDVAAIAFTGSREVGLELVELAHRRSPEQRRVKRVVCEMGGKNAIIVDEDADLDEAVAHILASAFGYQGQKCSAASRLITVGRVHERLLARLADALASWPLGPPADPQFRFGPLICQQALEKAQRYFNTGRAEGKLVYQGKLDPRVTSSGGYYFAPAIFADIQPYHRLAREEVFAPILAVLHAPDFETALAWANDSDYALTGGVFSRLPQHQEVAQLQFRVGNLYLNRAITGARVGIQPFGGTALSGTGVQAGSEDYLRQFVWSRMVSSNQLRHGYVPGTSR